MASVPSFDPNTFIPSIKAKDWNELRNDEAHPLVNRALSGLPPGSTFKIVTAFAGLRKHLGERQVSTAAAASPTAIIISTAGSARKAAGTARSAWRTRSRFPATPTSINTGTRPASTSIDTIGDAARPRPRIGHSTSPANRRAFCPGRIGWRFTARRRNGPPPTPRMSPLARAMCSLLRCRWRWLMRRSRTAASPITRALVDQVLNQDGTPALDEEGKVAVPQTPKVHADLRSDFTPEQIELVRHGLWKVVNEDGGTGRVARMEDVQVAGKTGTAQATSNGKKDNVAWFCCFAPYDHPEICDRRDGAGRLRTRRLRRRADRDRILQRTLAMDAGQVRTAARLGRARAQGQSFRSDRSRYLQRRAVPVPRITTKKTPADNQRAKNAPDGEARRRARCRARSRCPRQSAKMPAHRNAPSARNRLRLLRRSATKPRNFFERMFNMPSATRRSDSCPDEARAAGLSLTHEVQRRIHRDDFKNFPAI